MSTPRHPAFQSGGTCCNDNKPLPQWQVYVDEVYKGAGIEGEDLQKLFRKTRRWMIDNAVSQGIPEPLAIQLADEPWCPGCYTALERLRDTVFEVAPGLLKMVASVASFVPGIGTGVAVALASAASLAAGHSIDQAMLDAAIAAVPGGASVQGAVSVASNVGKGLLAGKPIDVASLEAARAIALQGGGVMAGAAFDGVLALSHGQGLQEAGFDLARQLVKGSSIEDQAAAFELLIQRAASTGRAAPEIAKSDLRAELFNAVGESQARAKVESVLVAMNRDPALAGVSSVSLAKTLGVPEPVARAALASWASPGQVWPVYYDLVYDPAKTTKALAGDLSSLRSSAEYQAAMARGVCALAASAKARGSLAYASLQRQCDALPGAAAVSIPVASVPVALGVAQPEPSKAKSVAIGGGVGAALLALLFFL